MSDIIEQKCSAPVCTLQLNGHNKGKAPLEPYGGQSENKVEGHKSNRHRRSVYGGLNIVSKKMISISMSCIFFSPYY